MTKMLTAGREAMEFSGRKKSRSVNKRAERPAPLGLMQKQGRLWRESPTFSPKQESIAAAQSATSPISFHLCLIEVRHQTWLYGV